LINNKIKKIDKKKVDGE